MRDGGTVTARSAVCGPDVKISPPLVVWDPRMLDYDFGGKSPGAGSGARWEFTWLLPGKPGCASTAFEVFAPGPADAKPGSDPYPGLHRCGPPRLETGLPLLRWAWAGHPGQSELPGHARRAALIAGGSVAAARAIARGEVDRAVNFCGGLHHAMPTTFGFRCLQRRRVEHRRLAAGRGAQGRVRGRRRASRRRRAGRVLWRPAGADRVHPPEPAVAVPRHRLPDRVRGGRRRRYVGQHRGAGGHRRTRRGCGPSTRSCQGWCGRSGPEVLVTQHGADSTGRTRWPT